jgi:X-X-X-Leu-X-X-Gly heptad repeat protein
VTSAQTRSSSQLFFDDLGRAVQANPVPAALIGMGALWMLMGGGRTAAAAALFSGGASRVASTLAPAASAISSGASRLADGVSDLAASAKEGVSELASGAKDVTGRALESVGDAATDGAKSLSSNTAQAGSWAGEQASSVGHGATGLAGTVQGNLAETFERQPLLVGVIGLAIGAAIAGAFRKTRFEEEMIGDQAGAVKEKVQTLVSEQTENLTGMANRALGAVKQEAETQGLTPSALKEGVAAIGKKAATAVKGSRRNGGPQSPG